MKPYIICHMLSSVDGKIDGATLKGLTADGEYEATGAQLNGDAWICGRTTMQQHFAEPEPFAAVSAVAAGPQPVYVARRAKAYAVAVDTLGKLRWSSSDIDGDHLICVLSERVSAEYLAMLRDLGISYIVSGDTAVDLVKAVPHPPFGGQRMMKICLRQRDAGLPTRQQDSILPHSCRQKVWDARDFQGSEISDTELVRI